MTIAFRVIGALLALLIATAGHAQNYPNKQVRIVCPYPPGGPTDVIARLVAQKLQEHLGGQFFVENLSGGGGAIGATAAARSTPDGSTLLVTTNDFAVGATTTKLSYDPIKNFTPISIIASAPQVIITSPEFPAKTMAELTALAKKDPGKYSYAGMSIGFGQLTAERFFKLGLKVDMVRVPFQGAAPLITSTMGNHTPIAFIALPPAAPLIKEGKLRALAVSSTTDLPLLPGVPPFAQAAGVPDFESVSWHTLMVPSKTPKDIVERLHAEMKKIMSEPEMKKRAADIGLIPIDTPSVDGIHDYIKSERVKWGVLVEKIGLKGSQ